MGRIVLPADFCLGADFVFVSTHTPIRLSDESYARLRGCSRRNLRNYNSSVWNCHGGNFAFGIQKTKTDPSTRVDCIAHCRSRNHVCRRSFLLGAVSLRQQNLAEHSAVLAQTLVTLYDRMFVLGQGFMPGVNDLLSGILLLQTRLVPRWLSIIGISGAFFMGRLFSHHDWTRRKSFSFVRFISSASCLF